jgi:3-phytase
MPPPGAVAVYPVLETTPVASSGDAADDPAIWVNVSDLGASRIIGTDKKRGIEVYALDGTRTQFIPAGLTNNVDLRKLAGSGHWSAIAAASNRSANTISLFAIDFFGNLTWLLDSEIETGLTEVYGLCMFSNSHGMQVFVNDKDGRYQQWGLHWMNHGQETDLPLIEATLLREFRVSSQPEGCVADDEHERLFLGVEEIGIKVMQANHQASTQIQSIADIDGIVLAEDVEGMSLFADGQRGYLLVSSQGNNSYAVYERLPPFSYRGSFVVSTTADHAVDGVQETDGLAVNSALQVPGFPKGVLVLQDGHNTSLAANQNFKLISWKSISEPLGL